MGRARGPKGGRRRTFVLAAWASSTLLAGIAITFLVVNLLNGSNTFTPHALMGPGYSTVGAMVLIRRHHRIGLLFLGFGFFVALVGAWTQVCAFEVASGVGGVCADEMPFGESLWPASYAFFGSLLLLFPTGTLPSRRWLPLSFLFAFTWASLTVGPVFGINDLGPLVPVGVGAFLAVATAPIFRVRKASEVERLQLRHLAYVLMACLVAALAAIVLNAVGLGELAGGLFGLFLLGSATVGIPVAVGVAILRYRLYDIDVVINKTLVYVSLTAILAMAYVLLVFGVQALLAPVTAESDLAIAASTLAVAALVRPLRFRLQGFIDRRFYRRKVDKQKTVEEFSARLRDEVDLEALSSRLISVVGTTMQPAHVSLWLRQEAPVAHR